MDYLLVHPYKICSCCFSEVSSSNPPFSDDCILNSRKERKLHESTKLLLLLQAATSTAKLETNLKTNKSYKRRKQIRDASKRKKPKNTQGEKRISLGAPFSPMGEQSSRKSCSHIMHLDKLNVYLPCNMTPVLLQKRLSITERMRWQLYPLIGPLYWAERSSSAPSRFNSDVRAWEGMRRTALLFWDDPPSSPLASLYRTFRIPSQEPLKKEHAKWESSHIFGVNSIHSQCFVSYLIHTTC
ncbi:hypothetical protein SLEP1_g33257 [Rubroshorea leprosula]|uniref:Uncharacterized protein n=1 Tax=Rubroshorea leprosula TaxID=152421 RepID=A0AAV5KG35_9ROSI|nr:hypothetical protein SLEP1_g33257 [Rubroshorea leprosula]